MNHQQPSKSFNASMLRSVKPNPMNVGYGWGRKRFLGMGNYVSSVPHKRRSKPIGSPTRYITGHLIRVCRSAIHATTQPVLTRVISSLGLQQITAKIWSVRADHQATKANGTQGQRLLGRNAMRLSVWLSLARAKLRLLESLVLPNQMSARSSWAGIGASKVEI